eukprot:scaffold60210_cov23-Tisochrysis_lutea.AAC.2
MSAIKDHQRSTISRQQCHCMQSAAQIPIYMRRMHKAHNTLSALSDWHEQRQQWCDGVPPQKNMVPKSCLDTGDNTFFNALFHEASRLC